MNPTLLAAATTLATLGWAGLPAGAETVESGSYTAPSHPMIITRTVVRTLADGKEIVARRSYAVTFQPDGQRILVSGRQIASEIVAPPALAALGELERQREEHGIFPIALDLSGTVLNRADAALPAGSASGAALAREMVAGAGAAPADKWLADRFIAETAARGATIPWPRDLFSPTAADHEEVREIALADGARGTVTVAQRIAARQPGGAPASLIREVITEIGGTRRTSREEWQIGAATGP